MHNKTALLTQAGDVMSMNTFITTVALLLFVTSISSCTSVDTGISGIWVETGRDDGFLMLNSNGEYCLARDYSVWLKGGYSVDDSGNIHLGSIPDVMFGVFDKVTLSQDGSTLTIVDMYGKKTVRYRLKKQGKTHNKEGLDGRLSPPNQP